MRVLLAWFVWKKAIPVEDCIEPTFEIFNVILIVAVELGLVGMSDTFGHYSFSKFNKLTSQLALC